jgi:hypothetical protein
MSSNSTPASSSSSHDKDSPDAERGLEDGLKKQQQRRSTASYLEKLSTAVMEALTDSDDDIIRRHLAEDFEMISADRLVCSYRPLQFTVAC